MFKFFDKVKKSKVGYTLTELIVVVAILGILAAIGIPLFMGQITSSKTKADISNAQTMENAYKIYLAENDAKTVVGSALTAIKGITNEDIPQVQQSDYQYSINLKTGDITIVPKTANAATGYTKISSDDINTANGVAAASTSN